MKLSAIVISILFPILCCHAQSEDPQQKKGSVFPAATAKRLNPSLEKVKTITLQAPLLAPPIGFNVVYNSFDLPAPKEIPWQHTSPLVIDFALPDFYIDKTTNTVKPNSEALADIDIEINSFRHLYEDTWSRDLANAGYPCPIFFFLYNKKQADSTHDYEEYQSLDGSAPIRMITNGKPVYVPMTQAQYLTYLIKYNKNAVDDNMRTYVHDSLTIANIPAKQDILKGERNLVKTWQERMVNHQRQLDSLSAKEKSMPAYFDNDQAQPLWTINPDYFNRSLPPTAIQLIVVKPEYHPHMASAFIKEKVMEIYHQIDYRELKTLIQN